MQAIISKGSGILIELLNSIGIIIIAIGAFWACVCYFLVLLRQVSLYNNDRIRLELGKNIILAVEFMLAADIVKTILAPNFYDIGMLGALVLIRTVLTYFLNIELVQLQERK